MRYIALNNSIYEIPEWFYQRRFLKSGRKRKMIAVFSEKKHKKEHQSLCDAIRKNYKPTIELSSMLRDD